MFADRLRALQGYEIVFVCDDSGSMNLELGQYQTLHFQQIFEISLDNLDESAGPNDNSPTRCKCIEYVIFLTNVYRICDVQGMN